ncbi:MAG TPA: tripartite tricarboxylate transporter substrate-binding protein [Candidatus Sulfotelmatobacter sp.]|nr:tripartite tricarboxylate transporter substrate-binding protein [Candidatus Sulfotelmatobacter sp.]
MGQNRKLRMVLGIVVLLVSLYPLASLAAEEKWPIRPITIYIGFAPGGGMDMMGRMLSDGMRKTLGVAMPVVNMTGANGAIAMDHVSKQPKDGYSLYGISSATCTFPATGLSKLSYKDFGMIGIVFDNLGTFSVPYDSPIKSAKDLIEGLKQGGLTGSNSGIGGMWHVPQLIVTNSLGGKFKAVPFDGGAPAALAAAKKEVDFSTSDLSEALTLIRAKMLRPLFVFDDKPYTLDGAVIPPITEFVPGIKDKLAAGMGWRALGYPRGVPEDRVKKLIESFRTAMESGAVKEFGRNNLLPLDGRTGAEADRIFAGATQTQSWLLYDIKEAKRSPQEIGIPRSGQ